MPLRLVVSLIVLSFAFGMGANVCLAQEQDPGKKPSPTPTPPPGGPNVPDPGGPSRIFNPGGPSRIKGSVTTSETGGVKPLSGEIGGVKTGSAELGDRPRFMDFEDADRRSLKGAKKVGRSYRARRPSIDLYSGVCDPTEQEQEDLTGTYSGNIDFPSRKLSGPATLDIKGRQFTLSVNGVELSGDVSSETTCDYTAVAMRFVTPPSSENSANAAESISLRARRLDSTLILSSVERQTKFKFTPTSKATRRRR